MTKTVPSSTFSVVGAEKQPLQSTLVLNEAKPAPMLTHVSAEVPFPVISALQHNKQTRGRHHARVCVRVVVRWPGSPGWGLKEF